ncbi:MAG TPA: hypothetical protein VJQ56_07810 [Blastocatellia bacterium]|nr:hypothetical protein [Blastocatellia bacterium]
MTAVRGLIESGGVLAEREVLTQGGPLSPAFRGVRKGVWMMLLSFPLALFAGMLTAINDGFAFLIFLPVLCFIIGFVRLLYATFKEEKAPKVKREPRHPYDAPVMRRQQDTAARNPELPPARVPPVDDFTGQRVSPAEMVRPPSVTENTTKLLDENSD